MTHEPRTDGAHYREKHQRPAVELTRAEAVALLEGVLAYYSCDCDYYATELADDEMSALRMAIDALKVAP